MTSTTTSRTTTRLGLVYEVGCTADWGCPWTSGRARRATAWSSRSPVDGRVS